MEKKKKTKKKRIEGDKEYRSREEKRNYNKHR